MPVSSSASCKRSPDLTARPNDDSGEGMMNTVGIAILERRGQVEARATQSVADDDGMVSAKGAKKWTDEPL